MKLIGITGGVGAGKTQVLSYLASHCSCRILLADDVANEVKLPRTRMLRAACGIIR